MTDGSIEFTSGPPETHLPPEDDALVDALAAALSADEGARRGAVSRVAARWPESSDAWARLGDLARDEVEAYAYYRVGYHRGLDRLRQNGWRGNGYVRWIHESNRGFLRALAGLERTAREIGEQAEAERCQQFLRQLDPGWPPAEVDR